ncbi:IS110 family transposase [Lactococcus lactis]|uniref:IS110 family transposase n=1 Tax=Lactococcus lactis TaxID=1358 RepID=UPI002416AAE6|nr:IS110 family transposase [Lactococcus lactis]MDG4974715.1 IS110 family transposase [Lactococcus lactis]
MTLFVGIDVSKYKHDLAILDEHGEILSKHFRFANTYQGFQKLKEHLETLELPTSELHIALEDTGHYADNLIAFLQNIGYPTFTYNPLIIKEFVKSLTLRKSKTDKKDALSIARKLLADPTPERYIVEPQLQELKELTRYQNRLIHERSKNKTLYVRTLDIVFPEFAKIVKNVHNQFVYDLLSKYPSPQKIKRAHFQSLLTIKRLTADKIKQIQEAAHLTIGNSSLALQLELTQLIDMIRIQTIQINKVQEQINHLMTEIDSPITSITGIGQRLGAIILAEIKNIHNFKTPSQLQAFAGLEPSIYQSGTMDITGHMVKRGSSYLRYALIQAAKLIANYSPHFRAYLRLKISQGKHYNVAVSHVAKKLIRIVYYLLKTNQSFDESKLR